MSEDCDVTIRFDCPEDAQTMREHLTEYPHYPILTPKYNAWTYGALVVGGFPKPEKDATK